MEKQVHDSQVPQAHKSQCGPEPLSSQGQSSEYDVGGRVPSFRSDICRPRNARSMMAVE